MNFRYASLFGSIPVLGLGGVCGWGFILKWEGFTRNDDLPEIAIWVEQKLLLYIFLSCKEKAIYRTAAGENFSSMFLMTTTRGLFAEEAFYKLE